MGSTNKKIYQRLATQVFLIPVGIVVLVGIIFATNSFAETSPNRPNIIVIQTDDQDLASINAIRPDTGEPAFPNILKIAEKGVRFDNNFVSHGICCPSRGTFYTGQYDHNHGVLTNGPPFGGYQKLNHTNTLPMWLQQAGYYTIHLGKYLNGYSLASNPLIPPGWTRWFTTLDPGMVFDYRVITETGAVIQYGNEESEFQNDIIARNATGYIARKDFGENPFFMVVDFFSPHVGPDGFIAIPAPRHVGVFDSYEPVLSPSFNEADVSDKPHDIRLLPLLSNWWINKIENGQRRRLESLLSVDEAVGQIVKALDKKGLLSNTIIVFTSDNGWEEGQHRIARGKNTQYDESLRTPLFIRGPGIPKGKVMSNLVVNVDYAPTFVDLADAVPGLVMDGRSLIPLIQNPTIPWRGSFLIENLRILNEENSFVGVHSANAVYIEHEYFMMPDTPGPDESELYVNDPYQLTSQHNNPRYASIKAELKNRLEVLRNCSGTNSASSTSCW